MSAPPSRQKRQRPNLKHGLYTMKTALRVLGSRGLPAGNTALGRELRAWRDSLVADLGGAEAVTTMQLALVEKAVTQKLICDSLDAYTLSLGSLVNKRHNALEVAARDVEAAGVPALVGELERVKAIAWARLAAPRSNEAAAPLEPPYSLGEASRLLLKSPAWLRRRAKAGRVPGARKYGRSWVFEREAFDRLRGRREVG